MVPEIRDRFSGAVEAFARRNGSGLGLHGDHSRHRSSDDVPSSSKDVVSILVIVFCVYDMNWLPSNFYGTLILSLVILCSKLILRGLVVLLVMAVLQKSLSCQAADLALLVSPVKAVLADWSQAVADYQQLRDFKLVLSLNHL